MLRSAKNTTCTILSLCDTRPNEQKNKKYSNQVATNSPGDLFTIDICILLVPIVFEDIFFKISNFFLQYRR